MTRKKLPDERKGIVKKMKIADTEIYLSTGEYSNGELGEVFIHVNKEGDRMRVYDSLAISISLSLQHGVPLDDICDKMIGQQFEPSGITGDEKYPFARSPVDYIFRYLRDKYCKVKNADN